MSLTVPNDGSVMHIANVTCAVCRGKQDRSMLQFTSCSCPPPPEKKKQNIKNIADTIFQKVFLKDCARLPAL